MTVATYLSIVLVVLLNQIHTHFGEACQFVHFGCGVKFRILSNFYSCKHTLLLTHMLDSHS